jgi:type 1 glutamine amidotransferase
MRHAALVLFALLALSCARDPSASPARPDASAPAGRPRFLVVTHTTGFRHGSIPAAESTLADLATSSAELEVDFARDGDAVATMMTRSALDGYAGVIFANTTGNVGVPDLAAFLAWIAEGHAFLGVHSAADTYRDAPDYLAMLGGEFATHGNICAVTPKVEDARHPAVAHLAPSFDITDEIYEWKTNPRTNAGVTVLFGLDAHPPDGHPEQGQPGDFPLAWIRTHGKGRIFYTALGHGDETWKDDRFRRHLLGAVRWALAP